MARPTAHAIAFALLTLVAGAASAQGIHQPVAKGMIIRMHMGDSTVRGRLLNDLTPSSTEVVYCAKTFEGCSAKKDLYNKRTLSTSMLTGVDRRGNHALAGAVVGGIIGVFGGYVVGHDIQTHECSGKCAAPAIGAVAGAALMAGIGAVLGGGLPRWIALQ